MPHDVFVLSRICKVACQFVYPSFRIDVILMGLVIYAVLWPCVLRMGIPFCRTDTIVPPCAGVYVEVHSVWYPASQFCNNLARFIETQVNDRDVLLSNKHIKFLQPFELLCASFIHLNELDSHISSTLAICDTRDEKN